MTFSSLSFRSNAASAVPQAGLRRAFRVVAASLVVAAMARVVFPLPFSPVPLSLQPLAVLCVGLVLGPVEGALALVAYLLEGVAGLPVFSPTGPGGLAQMLGPTGGYLMADPLVAFVAGLGARRFALRLPAYGAGVLGCVLAVVLLYTCGAAWLAHWTHAGVDAAWKLGVAPYLPGEMVKIAIAAGVFGTFQTRVLR